MQQSKQQIQTQSKTQSPLFPALGLPFASKKVFIQFLLATFLVVVVPILMVVSTNRYLKDKTDYSQLEKVAYTVIPALVLINIVIGVYIYRAIKDPQNYKKDPPLVIRPKKQ